MFIDSVKPILPNNDFSFDIRLAADFKQFSQFPLKMLPAEMNDLLVGNENVPIVSYSSIKA